MFVLYQYIRDIWISLFNFIFALFVDILTVPLRFKKCYRGKGRVHIIGNGPSLKEDYVRLKENIQEDDSLLCVNGFATSSFFCDLRPNVYMLVDEAFFKEYDMPDRARELVDNTYRAFEKVSWEMNLLVPVNRLWSKKLKRIKSNQNIHLYSFMNIPVVGGIIKFNAYLFYFGLATPLYQNILNAALYNTVRCGFKTVLLWGSDHNWLEERTVLSDNCMYEYDKHFYGKEVNLTPIKNTTVHQQLTFFEYCFRAYHELAKYANLKNVNVLNMSSKSWIDAFERK